MKNKYEPKPITKSPEALLYGNYLYRREVVDEDFEVWSRRDKHGRKEYLWKDKESPQGFGPFMSVDLALNNYKLWKKLMEAKPGVVIHVDFTRSR